MNSTDEVDSVEVAFGSALRGLREQRDLSQEDLASLCHIHRTYVSQLERGLKSPTLRLVWQICNALDVSPVALVSKVVDKLNVR